MTTHIDDRLYFNNIKKKRNLIDHVLVKTRLKMNRKILLIYDHNIISIVDKD